MRRIILAIAAIIAFAPAYAQTADQVVSDTTYTEQRGDTRFYVQKITYTSGRIVTDERPAQALDTIAEVNRIVSEIFPQLEQYAAAALAVSRSREMQRRLRTADQAITSLVGKSIFAEMDSRLSLALEGDYRFRQSGVATDVTISRTVQGNLRFRELGTNYTLTVISRSWIRVRYKNADLDLFWDGSQWVDLLGDVILMRQ
jgi:hypothetical protein